MRHTLIALALAASLPALCQTARNGSLGPNATVVTNEQDIAGIAYARAISNTWTAAQAADRATRASEDARVEGVASNLFAIEAVARSAGLTNLAAQVETVRTNLLQHFTALVDAERFARATNVWALVDAVGSESRATNAVSRQIAQAASNTAATAAAIVFSNKLTRIYSPSGADRWMDGDGTKWLSAMQPDTNSITVTVSGGTLKSVDGSATLPAGLYNSSTVSTTNGARVFTLAAPYNYWSFSPNRHIWRASYFGITNGTGTAYADTNFFFTRVTWPLSFYQDATTYGGVPFLYIREVASSNGNFSVDCWLSTTTSENDYTNPCVSPASTSFVLNPAHASAKGYIEMTKLSESAILYRNTTGISRIGLPAFGSPPWSFTNGATASVDYPLTLQTNSVGTVALQSDLAGKVLPTNALPGWLLFDTGSNKWYQVSVSNLSFTVQEVQ